MPAPSTTDDYLALVAKSGLLEDHRLEEFVARRKAAKSLPTDSFKLAQTLVFDGLLTKYQAEQLLGGRWRNFVIGGKYKLLEKLGKGGMALVFLCEHQVMKRQVALKILPSSHADDKELLGRFHREARALSQLQHPNIVGAYDVDHASKVHFLVMEYIDGGDLDQIVQRVGPLGWERSAHYIREAALGLQHAHECGLVHRDIKPGNLLIDRSGMVKLLDLGLARIFHETTDDLTTGRDARYLLGTVDYLAPEQALNSHDVDIRADIYGLGATFYFILTGKGLFEDGTIAQKLSWHLHRPPVPISDARPDVPAGLIQVIEKMLAKRPEDRYQTPEEVYEALEPWTHTPIPPPNEQEVPQLCLAARRAGQPSSVRMKIPKTPKPKTSDAATKPTVPSKATKVLQVFDPDASTTKPAPPKAKPEPVAKASVTAPPAPAKSPARPPRSWKKPIRVAMMSGVLVAFGIGGWLAWSKSNEIAPAESVPLKRREPMARTDPSTVPELATASFVPPVRTAEATITLVSGPSTRHRFPTLRQAIRSAKPGDRVIVQGSVVSEAIEASDVDGAPKNLTIEGINAGSKGKPVRWQAPRDISAGRALLDISGLEGFHLKGFLFDGQERVSDLVRLHGRAAGSDLEDLQFQGATRAGIVLRGWSGESGRPATIQKARFSTSNEIEAAILLESDPDRPTIASEFVRVTSSRFVGPFEAALMVAGPVNGLDVEQCRFFRATDGLRYRRTETRGALRVRLANNTFAELQRGLHFETTPPSASSGLVLTNNLFLATPRVTMLDKVSVQPSRIAAQWIWTEEGKESPLVPAGVRRFRKTFDLATVPEQARLDIGGDETFRAWLNGVEIARSTSPHFNQRVLSVDLKGRLQVGRNVLAVVVTNRADRFDAKPATQAGFLAQIMVPGGDSEVALVKTDGTWKCSDLASEGWNQADFNDESWTSSRAWPDDDSVWPWKFTVWDSVVFPQLKSPLEAIRSSGSGNVRDDKSWEGYPTLDSERVAIPDNDLARDPEKDPAFLHYSKSHRLATAGPDGSPVGVTDRP